MTILWPSISDSAASILDTRVTRRGRGSNTIVCSAFGVNASAHNCVSFSLFTLPLYPHNYIPVVPHAARHQESSY